MRAFHILTVCLLAAPCAVAAEAAQTPGPAAPRVAPAAPPDLAAPPADAITTDSGLAWTVLAKGDEGEHPDATSVVTVDYTGWTSSGAAFDSTVLRGRPSTLFVSRLMPGMRDALLTMSRGERRRLWIPEALAFAGQKGRPAGAIVMELDLVDFTPPPTVPPTDVRNPPNDVKRSVSGLAWRILREGSGTTRPGPSSRVLVHYSGWTTSGKLFDSSVMRGQPAELAVDQVIKGWTEALQAMVIGEKRRLWIPENLAYKGDMGGPRGMLVFDIELLEIRKR